MPSDLQITNIKDQANANSAITIASDRQITVNQNNPTVTLGSNTTLSSTVSLANATFPAGHIVQCQFRGFDSDQSIGNGSSTGKTFTNIGSGVSGEEFSIDMSVSSGNKIVGFGNVNITANSRYSAIKVFMDSTQIASGTETGSSRVNVTVSAHTNTDETNYTYVMFNSSFSFNYTPSDTSSHTYSVKAGNTNDNTPYTIINRPWENQNAEYIVRGYSSFILMEVQQ